MTATSDERRPKRIEATSEHTRENIYGTICVRKRQTDLCVLAFITAIAIVGGATATAITADRASLPVAVPPHEQSEWCVLSKSKRQKIKWMERNKKLFGAAYLRLMQYYSFRINVVARVLFFASSAAPCSMYIICVRVYGVCMSQ